MALDLGEFADRDPFAAIAARGTPRDDANSVTFSRPVSSGWKPVPTASSGSTRPVTSSVPPVGRVVPARICRMVDFPDPLVPTMPKLSPR